MRRDTVRSETSKPSIHSSPWTRGAPQVGFSVASLRTSARSSELRFKEWKSYANLYKFDTANQHIATGLIWASLCAAVLKRFLAHAAQLVGGKPISTRRVAMCSGHIIDELLAAPLACVSIACAFRDGMAFLLANARRSNPERIRNRNFGSDPVCGPTVPKNKAFHVVEALQHFCQITPLAQ